MCARRAKCLVTILLSTQKNSSGGGVPRWTVNGSPRVFFFKFCVTLKSMKNIEKYGNVPRLREIDFGDVYSHKEIQENLDYVQKLRADFESKTLADKAEDVEWSIAHGFASYADWCQDFEEPYTNIDDTDSVDDIKIAIEPVTVFMATDFDNLTARTNIIMVLNNTFVKGGVLSLKTTSSHNPSVIADKFGSSRKNEELPWGFEELTYVDAERGAGIRGKVAVAPHFVVGVHPNYVSKLKDMMCNDEISPERDRLERGMALKLINEMLEQAKAVEIVARQQSSREYLDTIKPIVQYLSVASEKAQRAYEAAGGDIKDLMLDETYKLIMNNASVKSIQAKEAASKIMPHIPASVVDIEKAS